MKTILLLTLFQHLIYSYDENDVQTTFSSTPNEFSSRGSGQFNGVTRNSSHLIDVLLQQYDKRLRPNHKGSPTVIGIAILINSISPVSDMNSGFTLDFYLRLFWRDRRLIHESPREEDLILNHDLLDSVWWPQSFFVNSKSIKFHLESTKNAFLTIRYDGTVTQSFRLSETSACSTDLGLFPMDVLVCSLDIESYAYTVRHIVYMWRDGLQDSVTFRSGLDVSRFDLKGVRLEEKRCFSPIQGNHSRLSCQLRMIRRLDYYLVQVYIPSSFLVVLSWTSFWLDRSAAMIRLGLSLTTVLTLLVFVANSNAALPKIHALNYIDVYLIACFVMLLAATVEFVIVSFIGRKPWTLGNRFEACPLADTVEGRRLASSGVWNSIKKINLNSSRMKSNAYRPATCQTRPGSSSPEPVWKSFEPGCSAKRDALEAKRTAWKNVPHETTDPRPPDSGRDPAKSNPPASGTSIPAIDPGTTEFNSDHLSLNEFVYAQPVADRARKGGFKTFLFDFITGKGKLQPRAKKRRLLLKRILHTETEAEPGASSQNVPNQNARRAKSIDRCSRVIFPAIFIAFVLIYCIVCDQISPRGYADE